MSLPTDLLARVQVLLNEDFFLSRNVNHENVQDICSAWREGGIGAAVGVSRTIPRYVSCSQSRTFPCIKLFGSYIPIYISKTPELFLTVHDTTWNILHNITFPPIHFMFYHGKSITFLIVYVLNQITLILYKTDPLKQKSCNRPEKLTSMSSKNAEVLTFHYKLAGGDACVCAGPWIPLAGEINSIRWFGVE